MRNYLYDQIERSAAETVRALKKAGLTLSLAESCTGGLIAATLTDIPGASDVFIESCVTYAYDAKKQRLNVRQATLDTHGAVSDECVKEMADGLLSSGLCDLALSVSGIAGPGGGGENKPVGTVYFGLAQKKRETITTKRVFAGNRPSVRLQAVIHALKIIGNEI